MTNHPVVDIYTDGACSGNPGPGGWGAVLRYGPHERELYGGEAATTTNNRMELTAPIRALETLTRPSVVRIYTDSAYVKDGVTSWMPRWKTNGWRTGRKEPVKNIDLWQRLDEALKPHQVEWHWVKGHAGHPDNERADRLAARGVYEVSGQDVDDTLLRRKTGRPVDRGPRTPTTPRQLCRATTRTGQQCSTTARPSGLCHVHDPALQCGAPQPNGKRCTVASGGGRCVHHQATSTKDEGGLFTINPPPTDPS
jgi:ribonuclease HI